MALFSLRHVAARVPNLYNQVAELCPCFGDEEPFEAAGPIAWEPLYTVGARGTITTLSLSRIARANGSLRKRISPMKWSTIFSGVLPRLRADCITGSAQGCV